MATENALSLAFAAGSIFATWYFWREKLRAERADLDATWLALLKTVAREDGPRHWLGLHCHVPVVNLSRLPNVLLAVRAEVRLPDGSWGAGQPRPGVAVGGPTPLPLELPAEQAADVKVWVWVETPAPPPDAKASDWAKRCLAWPPVLRLRLTVLEGRTFTLALPLAEEGTP